MKIDDLKNYGFPSYVLDIWKENYSPDLLPLQEEAVRNYGILDCGEGSDEIAAPSSKARNDREEETSHNHPHPALSPQGRGNNGNNNLLVVAPPSSGKSFLGEMATAAHLTHQKKCIYLSPFRSYAEEKYNHFKNLYNACGLETIISTRNRQSIFLNISFS